MSDGVISFITWKKKKRSKWPNVIKETNSALLFVNLIYTFIEIISFKGHNEIEEIIKEICEIIQVQG